MVDPGLRGHKRERVYVKMGSQRQKSRVRLLLYNIVLL